MHHIVKNSRHSSLIGGASIIKTKHHDSIKDSAHNSPKNNLYSIERIHIDLIVATEIKEKFKCLIVASTNMSILGRRNSSFRHALFRSQKSMQQLICPFFLLTG